MLARLNKKQVFVLILSPLILFLISFVCAGVCLFFKNKALADNFAFISLVFLVWIFIYNLLIKIIYLFKILTWEIIYLSKKLICKTIYLFKKLAYRIGILSFKQLILIICIFYIIPLFIQFDPFLCWYIRLPKVYGGDEEHYLIMLNSLIKDFDLDLKNNYDNARIGGYDAGELWRGRNLDPHTWYINKNKKERIIVYGMVNVGDKFEKWEVLPKTREIFENKDNLYNVRPHHPPGMPFILALLLWPLRGWKYIESAAIILITLLSIISLCFLYKMVISLVNEKKWANISIFLIALATPVYHYSLLLFKESFLASILVISCWFFFFKRNGFIAGSLISIACFTRYFFPIVPIPMFLFGIIKKEWRLLINFSIALALGAICLMLYNVYMGYGSPFIFSQVGFGNFYSVSGILIIFTFMPLIFIVSYLLFKNSKIYVYINNNPVLVKSLWIVVFLSIAIFKSESMKQLFMDLRSGLIPFSPIFIFGFLGLTNIKIWKDPRVAGILGVMLVYLGIYVINGYNPGSAYSARQLIPIVPLMAFPICYWITNNKNKALKIIFSILALYSFIVNFLASIAQQYFWHHPLNEAFINLARK